MYTVDAASSVCSSSLSYRIKTSVTRLPSLRGLTSSLASREELELSCPPGLWWVCCFLRFGTEAVVGAADDGADMVLDSLLSVYR